jgi:hypothetical protein
MQETHHRSRPAIWSRLKSIAPIAASSIALAISLLSLIWSQLLPAKIQVYPSEFGYLGALHDNLELHLYLTFTNSGATPGVVRKVAVLLRPPGRSDGYILVPAYFDRLDEEGNYKSESVVGPISVDGHQTVSRQIRFISARDRPGEYLPLLVRGECLGTILVWTSTNIHPTTMAPFPFVLSDRDLNDLNDQRVGKLKHVIELHLQQFQRWNARAVNGQEMRDLLVAH